MKKIITTIAFLILPKFAHAGGAPYEWLDFGGSNGRIYGIGEISNQVTFFLGDNFWISPIPGFVTYRKYYICLIVMGIIVNIALKKTGMLNKPLDRTSQAQSGQV